MVDVRKGQAPDPLARDEFGKRFRASFVDPAFRAEDASIAKLEAIAWEAFDEGRKSPITIKAGPGYADPSYDLSVDWQHTPEAASTPPRRSGPIRRRRRVPSSSAPRRATTAPAPARSRRAFVSPASSTRR